MLQWILAIVVVLLIIALFAAIVYMIVLLIKKWVRYRKTLIGNEDLLRELSDLTATLHGSPRKKKGLGT